MLRAVRLRSPSKSSLVCTQIAESFAEEILIRTNWRNAAQSWLVVPDFQSYQQKKKNIPQKILLNGYIFLLWGEVTFHILSIS